MARWISAAATDNRSTADIRRIDGATTARELFGSDPAIGEQIRIKNVPFTVIGLLSVKGQSGWGTDQDDTALVPLLTARRRLFEGTASKATDDYLPAAGP